MDLVQLGIIIKPQGLQGEVKVIIKDSVMESVKVLQALFIDMETGPVPYFVVDARRGGKDTYYLAFEDIEDRTGAEKITGRPLFIDRKDLKKIKEIGFAFAIGYTIKDEVLGEVGIIDDIYEMPANEVAQVMVNGKEILLPLNDTFVTSADKKKKILYTNLPEGILDV